MSTNSGEYIPDPAEDTHKKAFTITPAVPDLEDPFDLRRKAWRHRASKLTPFARLLFCRLTDMEHEPSFKRGVGVIECSKKFLADDFGCNADTVTAATRLLEASGLLWTQTIWTGAWEITRWFLKGRADESRMHPLHSGQNFGRRRRGVQRNVARGEGGKFAANPDSIRSKIRRLLVNGHGVALHAAVDSALESTMKEEFRPDHGEDSALTGRGIPPGHGGGIRPDRAEESALTGRRIPPGPGGEIRPDRAEDSALTGREIPPGHGGKTSGSSNLRDQKGDGEGEFFKRSTGLNAPRGGSGKARTASRENVFLLDVGAMMDRWCKGSRKAELANSGGWWRMGYRADPDLMERVLADTLAVVKEGGITESPGQHAADLWKRWGGKLPRKEPARV